MSSAEYRRCRGALDALTGELTVMMERLEASRQLVELCANRERQAVDALKLREQEHADRVESLSSTLESTRLAHEDEKRAREAAAVVHAAVAQELAAFKSEDWQGIWRRLSTVLHSDNVAQWWRDMLDSSECASKHIMSEVKVMSAISPENRALIHTSPWRTDELTITPFWMPDVQKALREMEPQGGINTRLMQLPLTTVMQMFTSLYRAVLYHTQAIEVQILGDVAEFQRRLQAFRKQLDLGPNVPDWRVIDMQPLLESDTFPASSKEHVFICTETSPELTTQVDALMNGLLRRGTRETPLYVWLWSDDRAGMAVSSRDNINLHYCESWDDMGRRALFNYLTLFTPNIHNPPAREVAAVVSAFCQRECPV